MINITWSQSITFRSHHGTNVFPLRSEYKYLVKLQSFLFIQTVREEGQTRTLSCLPHTSASHNTTQHRIDAVRQTHGVMVRAEEYIFNENAKL